VTNPRRLFLAAAIVLVATCAFAQGNHSEDGRTQYPAFMANSFFTFSGGSIGYLFTQSQLEPGFQAESISKPRIGVRIDFFGHHFTKFFSAQVTYIRPGVFVSYKNVNGNNGVHQVFSAYAGLTFAFDVPLNRRLDMYVEGGGGVTSRSGFDVEGKPALLEAHYGAGLLGGGLAYHATPKFDFVLNGTYSPGRRSLKQPSMRLYTAGLRFYMRPLPAATVEENRRAGHSFPANLFRLGYATNALTYGVNNFFSRQVPIFWGGNVETKQGGSFSYERNVFHTKKIFAFDLGASAGYWNSNAKENVFRTLSVYPLFRFFVYRPDPADFYFSYSLAGPTFISHPVLDERSTGQRFTFQDAMAAGAYIGKARHLVVELGIKHYSNGNLFPNNASIKVPLTFMIGLAY
jgi:hypothetical protein